MHGLRRPSKRRWHPTPAEFFEGCLSVDGFRAIVPRARGARVNALDHFGQPLERSVVAGTRASRSTRWNHLDGRLYIERMLPRTFISASSAAQHWAKLSVEEVKRQLG